MTLVDLPINVHAPDENDDDSVEPPTPTRTNMSAVLEDAAEVDADTEEVAEQRSCDVESSGHDSEQDQVTTSEGGCGDDGGSGPDADVSRAGGVREPACSERDAVSKGLMCCQQADEPGDCVEKRP